MPRSYLVRRKPHFYFSVNFDHAYERPKSSQAQVMMMFPGSRNIQTNTESLGNQLLSVAEPDLLQDDPSRKLMRQIFGAIAEYEKTMIVLKLRGARMRV